VELTQLGGVGRGGVVTGEIPPQPDADEPLGLVKREWPEHHAVDDAEDCGRGTNPERNDRDAGDSEHRRFMEEPHAEADVPEHLANARAWPVVARLFLCGVDAAKGQTRRPVRGLWGHPARDVRGRLALEVKAHLISEVGVDAAAPKQRTEQRNDLVGNPHASLRAG
jgi:hypothetical protein